jgi:hypothetical protein
MVILLWFHRLREQLLHQFVPHVLRKIDIGKLQVIYSEFSVAWETILNNQVMQNKVKATQDVAAWPYLKVDAVPNVNFWENKFKEHKKTLQDILKKLA